MKTTSINDIADALNISRITVSKALNGREGVSEETQRKIVEKAVELKYKKIDPELVKRYSVDFVSVTKNIAILVTKPQVSTFWTRTIESISDELKNNGFQYVYHFLSIDEGAHFSIPQDIVSGKIDGLIVLNIYDERVISSLAELNLPTVYFDIPPNIMSKKAKGDIILLEGNEPVCEITDKLIKNGRKKIGFIGDIKYATTLYHRWLGFKRAHELNHVEYDPKYCFTGGGEERRFFFNNDLQIFLASLKEFPDAFVCASDFISYALINYLLQKGYKVPEDIAVSGYDNIDPPLFTQPFLTTVNVDNDQLGRRLVKQLILRMQGPSNPFEVVYVLPDILYRGSTEI